MKEKELEHRKSARETLYKKLDAGELSLSEATKLVRKIYGLTQEAYAKKVGVSKMTVTDIERGKGNPTLKSINKILEPMQIELNLKRKKTN